MSGCKTRPEREEPEQMGYVQQHEEKFNWLGIGIGLVALSAILFEMSIGQQQYLEISVIGLLLGAMGIGTVVYDILKQLKEGFISHCQYSKR